MTLDSTTSKVQYTQSGTTTAWPVPYKFLDNEDLIVITTVDDVDTTLVLDTDYTVAGAGDDDGGTVTISPAVATGTRVTIYREIDLDQPTELTTAGGWFPKVHEAVFDRLTMIDQQLQEQLDRAVKLAPSTTLDPDTVAEELFEARDDAQTAAASAEDSASVAQGYAGIAVSSMDAAALSAAAAGLSESNAAGSEAAAAISAGAAYVDATTAESARDTAALKAEEAAASAAIAGAALNADAWSASVNYIVGDVVYTTTGKAYRCIDPNINNNPDTDDGSDWFLMSLALGEASNTAYRGDRGKTAYDHSQVAHAPSDAQKNSDITKAEIEAKLTGTISTHSHTDGNADTVDGYYAQKTAAADKIPVSGSDGVLADGWLPTRLGQVCKVITDWNVVKDNGWYMAEGANGAPDGNWYIGMTIKHNDSWAVQMVCRFAADGVWYVRNLMRGAWEAWNHMPTTPSHIGWYAVPKDVGSLGIGAFALVYWGASNQDLVAGNTYASTNLKLLRLFCGNSGGSLTYTNGGNAPGTWRVLVGSVYTTGSYPAALAQRVA